MIVVCAPKSRALLYSRIILNNVSTTMTVSKMFQVSLKYLFPKPVYLIRNSTVKIAAKP